MTEYSRSYVPAGAGTVPRLPAGVPLEASVRVRREAAPVVAIRGELDIATAAVFGRLVNDAITRYGPDTVVDAAGISFCDASGIGALVRAANHARRAGGTLTLVNVSPQLGRLLRVVGLEDHLVAQIRTRSRRPYPFPSRAR